MQTTPRPTPPARTPTPARHEPGDQPRDHLYLVNTRVRAGSPAPQQLTHAAEQRAQQLRDVSRAAFKDGMAAGEVLGTRAGWWHGYISGGVTGLMAGDGLVLVPMSLGYASVILGWFR